AGALVLALTVSPVLCLLLLGKVKSRPDNRLVRGLQWLYRKELELLLKVRWATLIIFVAAVCATGVVAARMGREFMPELEEGSILVRGVFPISVSLDEVVQEARRARQAMQQFPEIAVIPTTVGRPNDGMDTGGYYLFQANVPLRPQHFWP